LKEEFNMESRSVAYNPTPAPGMGGMMPGMQDMQGMMPGMQDMQGMQGMQGMHGAPGICQPLNMDPCCPPPCPPLYEEPAMHHHCPPPCPPLYEAPAMQHHCPMPKPVPTPEHQIYVVKKGDTIYKIAKRYGTTMQAIIKANNLRNPDLIYPGQILFIPEAPSSEFYG
ncbi:MAG TPA: LysM domain-containing protein, partial [Desulfosporosinus sp.]|nr:LysM domain-containing protein [Desulfosporosinus sp.]